MVLPDDDGAAANAITGRVMCESGNQEAKQNVPSHGIRHPI